MKFPGRINQFVIALIIAVSIVVVLISSRIFKSFTDEREDPEISWLIRLLNNIFGYLIVIVPLYLVLKFVHFSGYLDVPGIGALPRLIRRCFAEPVQLELLDSGSGVSKNQTSTSTTPKLLFCVLGLLSSYLTWGFLQEKVMTREYVSANGDVAKFKDSQFLVFVNRILAFCLAGIYLTVKPDGSNRSLPMYKYMLCSLSNILSSFCQYEALKYVTFPLQVLAKSCKVIPVMIMGKCVSSKKYENYEYITAVMISLGMAAFLLGQESTSAKGKTVVETTLPGILLLISYLTCDSFTSNWQGKLFSQYKVSSVQMMLGVNLFSCLLTTTSLLEQGAFPAAAAFMTKFPAFVTDCVVLSICSAIGQLFIFYTISQFGAVTFTIIMTIRQGLAILLSCIFYGHDVSVIGFLGIIFVFLAVFLRMYCAQRLKAIRQRRLAQSSNLAV
ncbi:adenosine 3'-phospho 5'-phosphosulfate transporter 1 [Neocloeon triangulifer]|uniref:adenosine 3'-phospho 5'-phosphosulfate transporter 1 n=1 Tax=Neocloeon triangulifer TaxID=2078957 RepID=UPI00286F7614|nr:adenosine 3'-phospho 5'-phosphosulfate transporter 1 [Neocloeon triangulifer]